MSDNPFEALDIDPTLDLQSLTELLRDRAEELPPEERSAIQGLWREMTLHPAKRLEHALLARPRSRKVTSVHKLLPLLRPPAPNLELTSEALLEQLTPLDLLVLPRYTSEPFPDFVWPDTPLSEDPFFEE